jgi:hypothetical protein
MNWLWRTRSAPVAFFLVASIVAPSRSYAQESRIPAVRAARIDTALRLDGRLDEAVYAAPPQIGQLIQAEPDTGQPSSERTEVWILFDTENVYVTFRCWDSHPERMIVNELRRDHVNISQNENVSVGFDTFLDRRNGLVFTATPAGARMDGEVADERQYNFDWNPVWSVAAGRFEGGWTAEMAIPFKSLRYRPGREQTWGLQVFRQLRSKNEIAYMTPLPADMALRGAFMWSLAGRLEGLEVPEGARRLEFRPYTAASVTTDATVLPAVSNDPNASAGLDVKVGVTQNLTADVTVNTDFGQVEADEQQVNLTRFSLSFPEKREFFLENQGAFMFGAGTLSSGSDIPSLFYSRRIGLHQGRSVPIRVGGRLTGRVGRVTVGALNIQSGDEPAVHAPATNFSVVRLKSDLLRRSNVGLMFGHRSVSERAGLTALAPAGLPAGAPAGAQAAGLPAGAPTGAQAGANTTLGVDATFNFYDNLAVTSYVAQTRTAGESGQNTSALADVYYNGDRYGARVSYLDVGARFNPEIGFVRRTDIRKSFGQLRFSPRPKRARVVRKYTFDAWGAYITNSAGRVDTREADGSFTVEFQSSDRLRAAYHTTYEFLPRPFTIAPGVTVSSGGYGYERATAAMTFGGQRRIAGTVSAETGTFYDGRRTTFGVSGGRAELTARFSMQPTMSINWVDLSAGRFRTTLTGSRVTYTMTPLMFVSALVQYNSSSRTLASNIRLRWEYHPGSELFVVYNDQREDASGRASDLVNRTFIVKINRLFRF